MSVQGGGGASPSREGTPCPTTNDAKRVQGLVSLRLQQLSSSDLLSAPTSKERRLSLVELEAKKRSRLIRQWEKMSQEIESAQKREEQERSRRQAISRQKSQLPPARRRFPMRRRAPSVVSSDCLDSIRPLDHEASNDSGQLEAEVDVNDGVDSAAAATFRRLTKSGLISPRTRPQGPAWSSAHAVELPLESTRGGLRQSPPDGGASEAVHEQEATEGKNWLVSACGRLPRAVMVKIGGRPSASDQTKPTASFEPHATDAADHDVASNNDSCNDYNDLQPVMQEEPMSEVEALLRQQRGSTVQASGFSIPRLTITASPDPIPRRGRQRRAMAVEGVNHTGSSTDEEEEDQRNAKSLIDEEYSSEEEKEDGDGVKVVVKCRSKTINRDDLEDPVKKQGWLIKMGDGLFAQWKKRWMVLEYPFLLWGTGPGKPPEDRISLRGGCMVDAATNGIKSVKRADCTFRVSGGKKMFLLEAASPEEKKEWIAALWTNVFYANPAKRHCGVAYTVELQMGLGQEPKLCTLVVDLQGLRMLDTTTKVELWRRPAQQIQSIIRPEEDKERWVIFDFGDNGGWIVLSLLPTTTPTSIFTSVQSILLTHMVWKGNPILLGDY